MQQAEVNYGLENNATVNYAHVHLSFVRIEAIFEPPTHYANYAPEANYGPQTRKPVHQQTMHQKWTLHQI